MLPYWLMRIPSNFTNFEHLVMVEVVVVKTFRAMQSKLGGLAAKHAHHDWMQRHCACKWTVCK